MLHDTFWREPASHLACHRRSILVAGVIFVVAMIIVVAIPKMRNKKKKNKKKKNKKKKERLLGVLGELRADPFRAYPNHPRKKRFHSLHVRLTSTQDSPRPSLALPV